MNEIKIKRIYEERQEEDGYRVLVDRLWPRGISKQKAQVDEWMKEIAPSNELRKWFGHDPKKFREFKRRYKMSLINCELKQEKIARLKAWLKKDHVTLLYAAKDEQHNHAVVLKEVILSSIRNGE